MRKELIVKQTGFKDCAVSCLLSIIRYYGEDISKEELSYVINTNEYGTSAYHMIEGMKKIGFDGIGKHIELEEIYDEYISCPFIAHVKNQNYYHFIVIYEVNQKKKNLLIMDPDSGKRKISFDDFKEIYLGSVLEFYLIKKLPKLNKNQNFINIIINYLKINKKSIYLIFVFSIISIILTLLSSLYYKILIDYFLINKSINILMVLFLTFSFIIILKNIFNNYKNKLLIKINKYIDQDLTIYTIKHILNLPYHYFKNKPTGEIISRINSLNDVKNFISNLFLNIFTNLFLILNSFIVLLVINKELAYITLFIMILYNLLIYLFSKIIKNKVDDLKISDANYSKELIDSIEGYETIKNLNMLNYFIKKIEIAYIIFLRKFHEIEIKFINQNCIKDLIFDFLNLIILSIGCLLITKNSLSIGNLILFITLISFFIEPMKEILNLIINYNYSNVSFERVSELLLIKGEKLNSENTGMIDGDIEIKNLSYSYNLINNVINNVNLKIKQNDKLLLYGKSGQGKSTLMKLLLKYIDEYKGDIYINKVNLKDIKTEIIRNSITYISQNERLFSGTLKENILLNRNISDEEYEKIIKICKVDEIIDKKLQRNNFLIEDNGFNLSGGERQRIILARGLLKTSNYLIFDECLSEVDILLEKEIIKNIFNYYSNKTIVYITHKEEIKLLFNNKYEC